MELRGAGAGAQRRFAFFGSDATSVRNAKTAGYGAFGYGYIIPATFLPALARGTIDKPAVFGLVWPVFGFAAAISTVVAAV